MTHNLNHYYRVEPGSVLNGEMRVPGDKSISHRAVMLSAIADGTSTISGLLEGSDVLTTIAAFRAMGVDMQRQSSGVLAIPGVGRTGLREPGYDLDMGNSGTALRLLTGLLAGQPFSSRLVGDDSLSKRPMTRVAKPLTQMGARIHTETGGTPPVVISPSAGLKGIRYELPIPSAQVKSAILLAGLYAQGETCVCEPEITRDHTERMLVGFGYQCDRFGSEIRINGAGTLQSQNIEVPSDLSSAAFFIVGASITGGSQLCLKQVGVNPTRFGIINILREMGANITLKNAREICGEPIADIHVKPATLRGIEVPREEISLSIDEIPVLCVAAACAQGMTVIRGAEELRHKESDRISAMVTGLKTLGIEVREFSDGLQIRGGDLQGGNVDSYGDHRIAMAFCIAGMRASGEITVHDCGNVGTSFPGFIDIAAHAGLRVNAGS